MPLIVVAGVVALVAFVLLGIAAAVAGRWSVYVDTLSALRATLSATRQVHYPTPPAQREQVPSAAPSCSPTVTRYSSGATFGAHWLILTSCSVAMAD
ncbi:hypothetical protein [Nocardia sp. NPDC058633]|uniref:hypothetical protein n=1 Tax=Nocardia sp. NPDC058633 TaxID=3346568 RepID=UPI003651989E